MFVCSDDACGTAGSAPTAEKVSSDLPLVRFCANGACPAPAIGYEKRIEVTEAMQLLGLGRLESAQALLDNVITSFQARTSDPGTEYVCVATPDELARARKVGPPSRRWVWLDWAFGSALYLKGALAADKRDWSTALIHLERSIKYRPFSPEAYNERGFVLNQVKQLDAGIASYRKAIELASDPRVKAMGHRGIGFALIEKKDLDGAQEALTKSLELDPGNPNALHELDYIRKLRSAP